MGSLKCMSRIKYKLNEAMLQRLKLNGMVVVLRIPLSLEKRRKKLQNIRRVDAIRGYQR